MEAFITGLGNISPQNTLDNTKFLEEIVDYPSAFLKSIDPNYKDFVGPILIRRMSHIIKMGVAAGMTALKDAQVEQPDAIITGTGLGCIEDTENFLGAIIENNERLLTPTPFIQSTHNTISAQIALLLKCNNYNSTYVHRGFSFETALLDAMLQIDEGTCNSVLVGGVDEITQNTFKITERLGLWKKGAISTINLLNYKTKGSITGEGASFFVLSDKNNGNAYAKIKGLKTFYKPENNAAIQENIENFLEANSLNANDIDLVVLGYNGDIRFDGAYDYVKETIFSKSNISYFKNLCGEYHTAGAFALWVAAKAIKNQEIPKAISIRKTDKSEIKNVLIYNHYLNINHSLTLLSKC
ncbi:MAG: beta-ketoacyl synthase chain length factor [Bacteroidetes bacterium]|nr:beta-ketoacyl synthase chain length factor [Bacteroidota bacterium]